MSATKVKPRIRADTGGTDGKSTGAKPSGGSAVWLCQQDAFDILCGNGYRRLSECPEILAGVDLMARLVASMPIHLMENTDKGDVRIHNELSRKIDIEPNPYMTRFQLVHWIVKTLWLGGNGNTVVYPETRNGFLENLYPLPPSRVGFRQDGWGYKVLLNGVEHDPSGLLHFAMNPDEEQPWLGTGYRVALKDVVENLGQAAQTKQAFLSSKWKPPIVVAVQGLTDEFSSPKGRKKLLDSYIATENAGEPWLIPAGTVSVHEVRPLNLNDLALADGVKLDKRTAAAILGMPPFLLGEGEFKQDAWNNFISTRIKHLAEIVQQVMTMRLLYNPKWYLRMNPRALYNYSMREIATIVKDCHASGLLTGNEGRSWLGFERMEGLDELVLLENYLPRDRLGDQKKLKGGDETSTEDA